MATPITWQTIRSDNASATNAAISGIRASADLMNAGIDRIGKAEDAFGRIQTANQNADFYNQLQGISNPADLESQRSALLAQIQAGDAYADKAGMQKAVNDRYDGLRQRQLATETDAFNDALSTGQYNTALDLARSSTQMDSLRARESVLNTQLADRNRESTRVLEGLAGNMSVPNFINTLRGGTAEEQALVDRYTGANGQVDFSQVPLEDRKRMEGALASVANVQQGIDNYQRLIADNPGLNPADKASALSMLGGLSAAGTQAGDEYNRMVQTANLAVDQAYDMPNNIFHQLEQTPVTMEQSQAAVNTMLGQITEEEKKEWFGNNADNQRQISEVLTELNYRGIKQPDGSYIKIPVTPEMIRSFKMALGDDWTTWPQAPASAVEKLVKLTGMDKQYESYTAAKKEKNKNQQSIVGARRSDLYKQLTNLQDRDRVRSKVEAAHKEVAKETPINPALVTPPVRPPAQINYRAIDQLREYND